MARDFRPESGQDQELKFEQQASIFRILGYICFELYLMPYLV